MQNKNLVFVILVVCVLLLLILFWRQLLFVGLLVIIGYLLFKFYGGSIKDKLKGFVFSRFLHK